MLLSVIFYQVFIFHRMISGKKPFRSLDFQIFVFWSSPLSPLSAIALEVDQRKTIRRELSK